MPTKAELEADLAERDEEVKTLRRTCDQLFTLSESIEQHPDEYDGPCRCQMCQSYANEGRPRE